MIGASLVKTVPGAPFANAVAQQRWFFGQTFSTEEAAEPDSLAALLMGMSADAGQVASVPSPSQLRQLRAAAHAVRGALTGDEVADCSLMCRLAGDFTPDETDPRFPVVAVADGHAWTWPLSRLRWLLCGQALQTLLALPADHSARAAIVDALDRLDGKIAQLHGRFARCA